jgi:hypothetical protein
MYFAELAANLSASSVYTDYREYEWIQDCLTKTAEQLADPGKDLAKLDQLLAVAAMKVLTKEMHWQYTALVESMALKKRPVAGRQVVHLIVEATKSSDADHFIISYETLKEYPWLGDTPYQIQMFYYEWQRLRKCMEADVSKETIRNILFDKIQKNSKVYDEDLAHYTRCKDKHTIENPQADYSLDFLESILFRAVKKCRENKIKSDAKNAIKKNNKNDGGNYRQEREEVAPAAEDDGKRTRKKGKGKGGRGGNDRGPKVEGSTLRTKEELNKICIYYQTVTCKFTDAECSRNHIKVKKEETELMQKGMKPKGKDKGKGKGKSATVLEASP